MAFLESNPEWLELEEIRQRLPLLYKEYFGLEKRLFFEEGTSLVERVLLNIQDKQYHDAVERTVEETEEREEEEKKEEEEFDRELATVQCKRAAKELFLAGKDRMPFIDVEKYRNSFIENQDLEDLYFEDDFEAEN